MVATTLLSPRRTGRPAGAAAATVLLAGMLAVSGCAGSGRPAAAPASAAGGAGTEGAVGTATFLGGTPSSPIPLPAVAFTTTTGRHGPLAGLAAGRVTLLYVGYTHCPDECPATMAMIAAALRHLSPAQRAQVQVLFLTADPTRDTLPVLRTWLSRYDPSFVGLRGPEANVLRTGAALGIPLIAPTPSPTGHYDVAHGTVVYGTDRAGRAQVAWISGNSVGDYVHDIGVLLR